MLTRLRDIWRALGELPAAVEMIREIRARLFEDCQPAKLTPSNIPDYLDKCSEARFLDGESMQGLERDYVMMQGNQENLKA
jgi:hypothetical protein